jgi:choline dehydrogenase-like flavoprotein
VTQIPDHNSGNVLGFAELAANTYDGKRYWSSNSYKVGANVTTWVQSIAEKIIFKDKRATAVQVSHSTDSKTPERVTVSARKEILVTSGVQGSAKLLLLRYVVTHRGQCN